LPSDGVRRRGDARLQRIVGRRVFCLFLFYCAAHKTLAKQLAVERRVYAPLDRNKARGHRPPQEARAITRRLD